MKIQLKKLRQKFFALRDALLAASPCKFLPADLQEGIEENSTKSVPYAGRVFGYEEVEAAVDSTLDFWLTLGEMEKDFSKHLPKGLVISHHY